MADRSSSERREIFQREDYGRAGHSLHEDELKGECGLDGAEQHLGHKNEEGRARVEEHCDDYRQNGQRHAVYAVAQQPGHKGGENEEHHHEQHGDKHELNPPQRIRIVEQAEGEHHGENQGGVDGLSRESVDALRAVHAGAAVEHRFVGFQHLVELRGYDFRRSDNLLPLLYQADAGHYGLDEALAVEACGLAVLHDVGEQPLGEAHRLEGAVVVGRPGEQRVDIGIGVALREILGRMARHVDVVFRIFHLRKLASGYARGGGLVDHPDGVYARHGGGKAAFHAGSERVAGFDFGHKAFRLGVVAPVDGHQRGVDAVGDVGHRGRVAVDGDIERRREQRIGPGSVLLVSVALACRARHEVGADGHRGNEHQAEIYAGVVGRFHFLSEGGDG